MSSLENLVLVSRFGHLKSMAGLFWSSSLKRWTETVKTNLGRVMLDLWKVSLLNKTKYLAPAQFEIIAVFWDYWSKYSAFLGQVYERKQ